MELGQLGKAIADFETAVKSNPRNAEAYVKLGDARLDQHDPPGAIRSYNEAIAICKDEPDAYPAWHVRLLRANVYLDMEKMDEAAADLTEASALVPHGNFEDVQSVLDGQKALAAKYAEAGRYADAAKWAEKSVALAPDAAAKEACRNLLKEYKQREAAAEREAAARAKRAGQ